MNPINLSAPVFVLKRQAKAIKLEQNIPLSEALDLVAQREGMTSWSMLAQRSADLLPKRLQDLYGYLNPGDLVLVGARPGMGKTLLACRLIEQAMAAGATAGLYSLVEPLEAMLARLTAHEIATDDPACWVDCSDEINAKHIEETATEQVVPGSILVIDYLQMLDERRTNPPLQMQIEALKNFAKRTQCVVLFLCQLDRTVEARRSEPPTLADIRLPNPLDLGLFNKILFLNRAAERKDGVELRFADQDSAKVSARLVAMSQTEAFSARGVPAYRIEDERHNA